MPSKDQGPLRGSQREGDTLKLKVDDITKEYEKVLTDSSLPDRSKKLKDLHTRCQDASSSVTKLVKKVQKLSPANEPTKVTDFNGKKETEIKRLEGLQNKLKIIMDKVEPDEVEKQYFEKVKKNDVSIEDSESMADVGGFSCTNVVEGGYEIIASSSRNNNSQTSIDNRRRGRPKRWPRDKSISPYAERQKVLESKVPHPMNPNQRRALTIISHFAWRQFVLNFHFKDLHSRRCGIYKPPPKVIYTTGKPPIPSASELSAMGEPLSTPVESNTSLNEEQKSLHATTSMQETPAEKPKSVHATKSVSFADVSEVLPAKRKVSKKRNSKTNPPKKILKLSKTTKVEKNKRFLTPKQIDWSLHKTWVSPEGKKTPYPVQNYDINQHINYLKNVHPGLGSDCDEIQQCKRTKRGNKIQMLLPPNQFWKGKEKMWLAPDGATKPYPVQNYTPVPVAYSDTTSETASRGPSACDEEEEDEEVEGEEDEYTDEEEDEELEDEETEYEDEEDVDDEEESELDEEETGAEDDDDDSQMSNSSTTKVVQYEAMSSYKAEQEGDLSFEQGDILTLVGIRDDGWWEAENEDGGRGLVPSTYLKEYSKYRDIQTEDQDDEFHESQPKSARLWKSIKNAVKETSATDVLHAMGAVPAGFRPSTLSKMQKDGDKYTMVNYLAPKLSASNLAFKDLFFNPTTNKIRNRSVRVQKVIQLMNCRQIPLPGPSVDILSRHVRMCLFDGTNVLSSIHVMRAQADKDQRTWTFSTKLQFANLFTSGYDFPLGDNMSSLDYAESFVRSNYSDKNVGILFELSMVYVRTKTNEQSELSCGWTLLPLYNEDGSPMANKSYDQLVNGGTPYEKGVEVDPTISRRVSTNPIKSLMSRNKQPRISIKVSTPTKEQKEQLDTLPDTLVGNLAYLPALHFYRSALADALLRDRMDPQSTEVICNPFLAWFPRAAEQHDLMDTLRTGWAEKLKTAKRADKKDTEYLKDLFKQTFMETVYPLLHCATIPPVNFGDVDNENMRKAEIAKILAKKREGNSVLAALLSHDVTYEPFDVTELSFDMIGPYCNST